MRELETLIASRTEGGAVSTSDLLEARKRVQSAAFLVTDAELALGEARDRLVLLTGQSRYGRIKLASMSCVAKGETDSLRISQMEVARGKIALEKAEAAALTPRVLLKPVVGGEIGINKLPVGLNLDVQSDILQGGALTAKANIARNQLGAAEAKVGIVKLEDSVTERGFRRILAAGDQKTTMLGKQIELLSQTRKLYRSQYFDMGTRRISELLDNEEEYYTRQAELAALRSDLATARINCAIRSRVLRRQLDLEGNVVYGFPLAPDLI